MSSLPPDEERISKRVVYEHETSGRQNRGAIIAIIFLALATLIFIFMQLSHGNRPHRKSGLLVPAFPAAVHRIDAC